jgi:selT/selW/selH-like putative selenoprotein
MPRAPRIEIEFCTQCRWLLRAGWTAQELLTTFQDEIGEVALIPGTGGIFEVRVDGAMIWSRKGGRPLSGDEGTKAAPARCHFARARSRSFRPEAREVNPASKDRR